MEKEEAKEKLNQVLIELNGGESSRPKGEGISSNEWIEKELNEIYSYYFCSNK